MTARLGLALLAAATLGACYEPDLADCTVTCSAPTDCADGQVCGPGGLCLSPNAQACSAHEQVDAGPHPADVMIHVTIDGNGKLTLDGTAATCVAAEMGSSGKFHGDCMWQATPSATHHLLAIPSQGQQVDMWSGGCSGGGVVCELTTGTAMVMVGMKFK